MPNDQMLPTVVLVRHGETEWSRSGRHTGRTDLPLTAEGERVARRLAARLGEQHFDQVFSSPLLRARRTAELARHPHAAIDPDLAEWDYGEVEGLTTAEYRTQHPGWAVFSHGARGGESVATVGERADRVVAKLRAVGGTALLFSHGHFLRVLAARWVGVEAAFGRGLALGTAALCVLGYEHTLDRPAIRLWNDTTHL